MKKPLFTVLLTASIFTLNTLPSGASTTKFVQPPPGQWCFELPGMGHPLLRSSPLLIN